MPLWGAGRPADGGDSQRHTCAYPSVLLPPPWLFGVPDKWCCSLQDESNSFSLSGQTRGAGGDQRGSERDERSSPPLMIAQRFLIEFRLTPLLSYRSHLSWACPHLCPPPPSRWCPTHTAFTLQKVRRASWQAPGLAEAFPVL